MSALLLPGRRTRHSAAERAAVHPQQCRGHADEGGIRPLPGGRRAAPAVRLGRPRRRAVPAPGPRPLAPQLHGRALAGRGDRLDPLRRGRRSLAGALRRADRRRLQGDRAQRVSDHGHPVPVLPPPAGRLPVPGPAAGLRGQRPRLVRVHERRRPRRGLRRQAVLPDRARALRRRRRLGARGLPARRRPGRPAAAASRPAPSAAYCAYVAGASGAG